MAVFENFPYTNVHELNLDWIIKQVKIYIEKYTSLEEFVNSSLEQQQQYIDNALEDIRNDFQELSNYVTNVMEYIRDNIERITNEVIIEMIREGTIQVGFTYDAENEALDIVVSEGEQNG